MAWFPIYEAKTCTAGLAMVFGREFRGEAGSMIVSQSYSPECLDHGHLFAKAALVKLNIHGTFAEQRTFSADALPVMSVQTSLS